MPTVLIIVVRENPLARYEQHDTIKSKVEVCARILEIDLIAVKTTKKPVKESESEELKVLDSFCGPNHIQGLILCVVRWSYKFQTARNYPRILIVDPSEARMPEKL